MNVLLAVDVSDATEKALEFVGRTCAASAGVRVTLLHVVERLPDHLVTSPGHDRLRSIADEWASLSSEAGEQLLATSNRTLVEAGVDASRIECKLSSVAVLPESRRVSASIGVIEEMKSGDYDVVCLGRRGSSAAAASFVGSVAQNVLREAEGLTVWIVD